VAAIGAHGREADKALWRSYAQHMKGKAQLFWSPGLRARLGVGEKSDEEIVEGEEQGKVVHAIIPGDVWDDLRQKVPDADLCVRELVEDGGFALVDVFVFRRTGRHARRSSDADD
jgi:hypothetical protein